MGRRRWRKRSNPRRFAGAFLAPLLLVAALLRAAPAAAEVTIVPAETGDLGAWLALGPVPGRAHGPSACTLEGPLLRGGENALTPRAGTASALLDCGAGGGEPPGGAQAAWHPVLSAGPLDLGALLKPEGESFALLFGVLQLEQRLHGALLVGASDGVRVVVDGRPRLSDDAIRVEHDDEELVPVDLAPGDHTLLIKLHHRQVPWAARIRVVDDTLAPPKHATFRLPGTSARDEKAAATLLAQVGVDWGLGVDGYRPEVTVRFPGGILASADHRVRGTMTVGKQSSPFEAGTVSVSESGPPPLRALLPPLLGSDLSAAEQGEDVLCRVEVASRSIVARLAPRPWMREAVADANRARELAGAKAHLLADPGTVRATIAHLEERVVREIGGGETDLGPTRADAAALAEYVTDLQAGRDPLKCHAGVRRMAYRSPLDGGLSPFGLYVPASYAAGRPGKYPLVVALHGMNGKPLSMLGWVFGHDDPAKPSDWEDRHLFEAPEVEAFVLAPNSFGNAMYRELGEVDVMTLLDWATRFYPIDPNRVTITGISMGGTGSAAIALHHPDRFAAAAPLCGYQSYFIRGDFLGRRLFPWETLLAEQRSPALWAENGHDLPLSVWHGRRDVPEKNSYVLIDRYRVLGYDVVHEHPNVGHDVWRLAYEDTRTLRWLLARTRPEPRSRIFFKTDSLRFADDGWVHVRGLSRDLAFGQIDARVTSPGRVEIATQGVDAFALDRTPPIGATPIAVRVDGTELPFDAASPLEFHRERAAWARGPASVRAHDKRAALAGPIRDVFNEPLVFVYGTQAPEHTRANQEVARAWARVRFGVDVHYPIVTDMEVTDAIAERASLVLVGSGHSNRIVADLEPHLPFRVVGDRILAVHPTGDPVDASREAPLAEFHGTHAGVVFVYPNPKHPSRYVLVIEGVDPFGTLRSGALPDLLPDYVVYDDRVGPARGQLIFGSARPLAAGLFERDWSLAQVGAPPNR